MKHNFKIGDLVEAGLCRIKAKVKDVSPTAVQLVEVDDETKYVGWGEGWWNSWVFPKETK